MKCLTELEVFTFGYEAAIAMIYLFQDVVSFAVEMGFPDNPKTETVVFTWVPQLNAYFTGIPL